MKIDLPVEPGDTVYYLVGIDTPRIEVGTVEGAEIRNGYTRIIVSFSYFKAGILANIIGTRLFLSEKEANLALSEWTKRTN